MLLFVNSIMHIVCTSFIYFNRVFKSCKSLNDEN